MRPRLVALAALALALAAVWLIWIGPFLAVDDCMDHGGAWRGGACMGARTSP
jgi:hypothetical protein